MFGKNKTMKGVIASFTSEARAIAKAQKDIIEAKLKEIEAAQSQMDAAIEEAATAEAFIKNISALCCPAVKGECPVEAVATEVK